MVHRDKTCKLRWSRTNGGLVKNQCRVYDNQIFVVGDYEKHECAIQVRAEAISKNQFFEKTV